MGREQLLELLKFCLMNSVQIGGCGCCGSPIVSDEDDDAGFCDIKFDYEKQVVTFRKWDPGFHNQTAQVQQVKFGTILGQEA